MKVTTVLTSLSGGSHSSSRGARRIAVCFFILVLGATVLAISIIPSRVTAQQAGQSPEDEERQQLNIKDVPYLAGGWAGLRRALLSVFGVVSDPNQADAYLKDQSLARQYFQDPGEREDLEFLQAIAPAMVYLPTALEKGAPGSPQAQAPASPGGRALQATTGEAGTSSQGPQSCDRITTSPNESGFLGFLRDCTGISRQRGIGRVAMLREGLFNIATRQTAADTASFIAGEGARPKFKNEQSAGAGATGGVGTGGPSTPPSDEVQVPLGVVKRALDAVHEIPVIESLLTFGTTQDLTEGTDTNRGIPTDEREESKVCITGPDGQRQCLGPITRHQVTGHAGSAQGGGCATCGTAASGLPSGLGSVQNGLGQFFGGNLPGLVNGFFGANSSLFQGLVGPERFWALAQQLFGGAGSGGGAGAGPPRPSANRTQSQPPCDERQARLTREQALELAQLFGMDPTASSWDIAYQPTSTAVGTPTFNLETNQVMTLQPADFRPVDSCIWLVAGPRQQSAREVVIISDTTDPAGMEYHLLVRDRATP